MSAPFVTSAVLGDARIRHGFFGREGGVSDGDFSSLNMSVAVGDDPARVAKNRSRAMAALDLPAAALGMVKQVHSSSVVVMTEPVEGDLQEADAMVTGVRGLTLGILTADCTPILLADPDAGVIGAAHAGWKGAADDIVYATVIAMVALGADPARIRAAIGPTISAENYEVGPQFAADLVARHPQAAVRITKPAPDAREHFDLPGFVGDQLVGAGVGKVDNLHLCTYAEPKRWFSHRWATHQGTTTGRQVALIALV